MDKPGCRAYSLGAFNVNPQFTESKGDYTYDEKISNIYDPNVYVAPPNGFFVGVWQTERYFNVPVIRKELTLRNPVSDDTQRWAEMILASSPSCFIHIRHSGDYALPEIQAIFGGLDITYYRKAVEYIKERIPDITFFIITDDFNWAKLMFPDYPIIHHGVGDGITGPAHEHEDLWLMSLCNHAIIPSSSFGWWGAWLGDERMGRIVVTPDPWYKIQRREQWVYDARDIIPPRWVRLVY